MMSPVAPILERAVGKIRFSVDEVERAAALLATESGKLQLERRFDRELLTFSHSAALQLIAVF